MNRKQGITIAALLVLFSVPLLALDKNELSERYKGKFLVVMREGLAVGTCTDHQWKKGLLEPNIPPELAVRISGESAEYHEQAGMSAMNNDCGAVQPEPIHKGEVLKVDHIYFRYGHDFTLVVDSVSPHAVERGVGAYEHRSFETGRADLIFLVPNRKDFDSVAMLADNWVRVFNSQEEAAKFVNTASGVFVKEVKLGMTPAEVESVMGPPVTKADLGEKMLYKYKDMTIEFHDGKVTDVR